VKQEEVMPFKLNPFIEILDYYGSASGEFAWMMNTRDVILATTPTVITIALSTDEPAFYIWNGSAWKRSPIIFGTPSTGVDMGAIPFEDDNGYGLTNLSNKNLGNVVVGDFDTTIRVVKEGAIKYIGSPTYKLSGYLNAAWRNFLAYTDEQENDLIQWSDDFNEFDVYGKNKVHGHTTDMGIFASDHWIDGGLVSDQLV
jgi:hypothetical protein